MNFKDPHIIEIDNRSYTLTYKHPPLFCSPGCCVRVRWGGGGRGAGDLGQEDRVPPRRGGLRGGPRQRLEVPLRLLRQWRR